MFQKLITATALIALSCALTPVAHATLAIELSDGVNAPLIITDGGAGDVQPSTGAVTFAGSYGAFSVNVTTGLGYPTIGSPTNPALDLNSVNAGTATGGTLTIKVSQTGFATTGLVGFNEQLGGNFTGTGEITEKSFIDLGNGLFVETSQIGSTIDLTTSPFAAQSNGIVNTDGSYSLTEDVTFTVGAGQFISFDAALTAVPEPASLAILGSALLGLGWIARRRRSV